MSIEMADPSEVQLMESRCARSNCCAGACTPGGNSFVSMRAFFLACDILGALTKIDSAGRQQEELRSFAGYTEIHECISSEVVSNNIELYGSGEDIKITRFISSVGVHWVTSCDFAGGAESRQLNDEKRAQS
jgi:hypothetical protein